MPHHIVGHAIVSVDGNIASADGAMPSELRNDADWQRFQAQLDASDLVVLGRQGHERHPNPGRKRLVATTSVHDLAQDRNDPKATLWNPAGIRFEAALTTLGLADATIAIAGVFDLFRDHFTAFDLAENHTLLIRDGLPCFTHAHPRIVLSDCGLTPEQMEILDPNASVTLTHWRRL